ncbi:MAG: hypothetical protein ACM3H8_10340 [Sphingobacteriales bacterium]
MKPYFKIIIVWIIFFSSCIEIGDFKHLGNGFKFGYFENSKSLSNVYYNDVGIINGVCYSVEWNADFILMESYPYINGKIEKNVINIYLLNKKEYIKNPSQLESKAVVGPLSYIALDSLKKRLNIVFTDKEKIIISD